MRAAGFSFFYRILSKIFQKIYRIQMGIQETENQFLIFKTKSGFLYHLRLQGGIFFNPSYFLF